MCGHNSVAKIVATSRNRLHVQIVSGSIFEKNVLSMQWFLNTY